MSIDKELAEIVKRIYLNGQDDREGMTSNQATVIPNNVKSIKQVFAFKPVGMELPDMPTENVVLLATSGVSIDVIEWFPDIKQWESRKWGRFTHDNFAKYVNSWKAI